MLTLRTLYDALLASGLTYRYRPEHLASLKERKLGFDFTPPSQIIETRYGRMIDEAIPTSLEPAYYPAAFWEEMKRIARAWERFFQLAYSWYTKPETNPGPLVFSLIGQGVERTKATIDPGYRSLLPFVRYDCLLRADGSLVIIDVNSSRPIGAAHMEVLGQLFTDAGLATADVPPFSAGIADVLDTCYTEWCASFDRKRTQPSLAIVIPEHMGSVPDFLNLRNLLRTDRRFHSVDLVDPADLVFDPSSRTLERLVGGRKEPVELVLRTVKPDLDPSIAPALNEAYPAGACIVGPLYHRWLGSKFWFIIAQTEPYRTVIEDALGPELAPSFFRSLPESGLYEAGIVKFGDRMESLERLDHKDWVAKVAAGSSARGVIIGNALKRNQWLEAVCGYSDGRMVIQRYTPPPPVLLTAPDADWQPYARQYRVKLGLYVFGGEAVGFECMACRDSRRIHGGRSTLIVPVLENNKREQVTHGIWTPGSSHSPFTA